MIEIDYIHYSKLNHLLGYSSGVLMGICFHDIPDDIKKMIDSEIKKIEDLAQKVSDEVFYTEKRNAYDV